MTEIMSTGAKRKRVVLSLQQKLDIIRRLDQGESVANLAQEYNVGKTSVTDIKMRKDKIINYVSTFKNADCIQKRKTMKCAYNKELDKATFEWYLKMEKAGFPVTSQAICSKAIQLNKKIKGSPDFKASGSWLRNFKSRHGLDFSIQSDSSSVSLLSSPECDTVTNNTSDIISNHSTLRKTTNQYPNTSKIQCEDNDKNENFSNCVLPPNFPDEITEIQSDDLIYLQHSSPLTKRKRVVLSLKQKIDIINRIKNGENENSLAKEYNIAYSSLKAIKTNQNIIMNYVSSFESPDNMNLRKTMKSAYNTDLDEAVFAWYKKVQGLGRTVTGQQICDKALELNKLFCGSPDFKASNGWLKNFKSRHGLPVQARDYSSRGKHNQNFDSDISFEENSMDFSESQFEDCHSAVFDVSNSSQNHIFNHSNDMLANSHCQYSNSIQSDCFPSCDVILTVPDDSDHSCERITEELTYSSPPCSQLARSFDMLIDWVYNQKECSSLDVLHLLKLRSMACKKEMAVAFSSEGSETINRKIDSVIFESRHESISIDDMYEIERCTTWITSNGYSKVALQFPDSMLNDATSVCLKLGNITGQQMFVLGDTSYGSCCVDEVAAEHISADAIIHFGHSCLSPTKRLPVLYVFGKLVIDAQEVADAFKTLFPDVKTSIIIIYEVMYIYVIDKIVEKVAEYQNLIISKLDIPGTPCDTAQTNDNFFEITKCHRHMSLPKLHNINDYNVFYIGSRAASLTNAMLAMRQCLFHSYNPVSKKFQVETLNVNHHLKRRYYYIEKAKDAKIIGILVGTLGVANYIDIIKHLKELIKNAGKKSYTLVVGKLNAAKLANFAEIDIFVNVACPESSLVDSKDFYQSIVTPFELEIAFNKARSWTGDYEIDFQQILPGSASYMAMKVKTEEEEGDVSLISGRLRQSGLVSEPEVLHEQEGAIVKRSDMKLSTIHKEGAGEFLTQRTWQGLEQHLGVTPVPNIEQGQKGIACKYEDEKSSE